MQLEIKGLEQWVAFLGHAEIPVLGKTARDLAALREDAEKLHVVLPESLHATR